MLKKSITLGVLLIFIGSIGCMVTYKGYAEQYKSNDIYSQEYNSRGVDNIEFNSPDWAKMTIEIVSSTDTDKIKVDAKYADDMVSIKSSESNGTINIDIELNNATNMGLFFRGDHNTMVVSVPENYKGNITVGGGLDVDISYLDINSVYLMGKEVTSVDIENCNIKNEIKSTTNANVTMTNCTVKNIDIVGWGKFREVTADNLSIDSNGNGYIELTDVDVKNDIYIDGGEVEITNVTGNELNLYSQYGRKVLTDIQINNDIVIKNGNGEIVLSDVSSENIDINNKNGTVTIEDLTTGQLVIDAKNGDINILESETDTSEIRNEYGIIRIDDLIGSVEINNKNGDVVVERGTGDIDIYNKYGNVEIDRPEIKDNITVNSKNGDVDMYVSSNNAYDVGFDINVSNGNISDEDRVRALKKDGNKKVKVNVGYGNFNID